VSSDRISFQLMMDTLGNQGLACLHHDVGVTKVDDLRQALTDLGLLTCSGPGSTPTPRGWRVLAAWWKVGPGEEEAPGPLCDKDALSESASYMATGRYRVDQLTVRP